MTKDYDRQEFKNRVYRFSVDLVRFVNSASDKKSINYCLIDQLLRASTSIGANFIEAKASSSKREFIRYFEIALKSANETKYWLCLFRDALDVEKDKINEFLKEVDEISKILASSIITMKGTK